MLPCPTALANVSDFQELGHGGGSASSAVPLPPPPLPPPPPPPPPYEGDVVPDMVRAAPVMPAVRGRNEVRFVVGCGYIVKNESGHSLDGHCQVCKAAVNKKFTPFPRAKAMHKVAQGRPLGLLLAWLELSCPGDMSSHREALESLDFEQRLAARQRHEVDPDAAELFAAERAPHPSDDRGEPIVSPL